MEHVHFLQYNHFSLEKNKIKVLLFDRCKVNDSKVASCWYGAGGNLLPFNYSNEISLVNINHIVLVGGNEKKHYQDIANEQIQEHVKCKSSEGENSSIIIVYCENVSSNEKDIKTQAPSTFLKCQDNDSSSNCVVSEEMSTTDMDVGEEIKQLFSVIICFGICFSKC